MGLTKYGLPQVAAIPAILLTVMAVYFLAAWNFLPESVRSCPLYATLTLWLPELLLLIILVWVLSFFRDPLRTIPDQPLALLSPADGTITDIETIDGIPGVEGTYTRIGIFMSIFNVHINRAPCAVRIEKITYHPGRYTNAMDPACGRINESNDIIMTRLARPHDKLMLRQITGAVARRIVCQAVDGQELAQGEKFGMLKFGSRTELYFPADKNIICRAKPGQKVKAGLTVLAACNEGPGND